jgi:hypothetical protein
MMLLIVFVLWLYLVLGQSPRLRELLFWLIVITGFYIRDGLHSGADLIDLIPIENLPADATPGDDAAPLDEKSFNDYSI